jgi:hypothetical protein
MPAVRCGISIVQAAGRWKSTPQCYPNIIFGLEGQIDGANHVGAGSENILGYQSNFKQEPEAAEQNHAQNWLQQDSQILGSGPITLRISTQFENGLSPGKELNNGKR